MLPRAVVSRSFKANPHGWGLAWTEQHDGVFGWWYAHGMDEDSLLAAYDKHVTQDNIAMLHCRIASKGGVSLGNAHPFPITRHGALLMHNGTLNLEPVTKDGTDSEALAHWFSAIRNLPTLLQNEKWVDDLAELLYPSKVAVMFMRNGVPDVTIFNEYAGVHRGRLWASNDSAFDSPTRRWRKRRRDMEKRGYQYLPETGTWLMPSPSTTKTTSYGTGNLVLPPASDHERRLQSVKDCGTNLAVDMRTSSDTIVSGDMTLDELTFDADDTVTDMVKGPPYAACMQASDHVESAESYQQVLSFATNYPEEAAKALWYYRLLMGG